MSKKILTIASILPVPGLISENSLVIKYIQQHLTKYPDDKFVVFRPSTYLPSIIGNFTKKSEQWKRHKEVAQLSNYQIEDLTVYILPYMSIGSIPILHSLLSYSAYFMNRLLLSKFCNMNIEIIHAHNLFPDGLIAYNLSRKFRIPYCLTLRDERRMLNNKLIRIIIARILNNADYINTFSWLMKMKTESLFRIKVNLTSPGIHKSFFSKLVESNRSSEKIKFVSVANIVPIKNLESVLKAFSLLADHREISYTIIGDGPEKERLIKMADELKLSEKVSFQPSIQNNLLANELVNYDIFIQPSFKETFGLSYFEALACGLPVILTENTGAYYHIKDMDCYLVVDPYNIDDIKEKILISADRNWINRRKSICKEAAFVANWGNYLNEINQSYLEAKGIEKK